jgi:LysM repeat protein
MTFPVASGLRVAILMAFANSFSFGQTMAPTPNQAVSQAAQLQELAKKIDEQNAKIDMLSQEILKLQLEITNHRPGVMIGEGAPASASTTTSTSTASTSASTTAPAADSATKSGNGNNHIVARGETLTSIAKMHGVSVSELQKYNHIDNPLKLQAGQTLLIPPSPIPSPPSSGE